MEKTYPPAANYLRSTHLTSEQYKELYQQSITNPEQFWAEQAKKFISWNSTWQHVISGDFQHANVRWFAGATLNACYNCLDRHLPHRANQTAIIWEGDSPKNSQQLTYQQLHERVCKFANILKKYNIKKGDRVCIYLPMIPEAAIAMLACARIGAIHSVVFAGFSAQALKTRIIDADCNMVITADEGLRAGKTIPLKQNVDTALIDCPNVKNVIVINHTNNKINFDAKRDIDYVTEMTAADVHCACEIIDANDPLFILYTSGSTGKPKGIQHSTAGYLLYAAITYYYIFDYHDGEIFWCTADVGWITGHTYTVYGPLLNGATTLMFEGVPNYPDFSRYWNIIDKYQVNIFYTAPTAIRALRKEGDAWVTNTNRSSLKLLGSVGEPINPEVWEWYYEIVGDKRCPIVDTWWQTETGGVLISPLPGATTLKPGAASIPFFGIVPAIVDDQGHKLANGIFGKLIITQPWPGIAQTIYNNPERFMNGYFAPYPGNYLTGDSAQCDSDGYYWIKGRDDDVIKISGHRIGTAEIESALVSHSAVSEAAVVAIPDEIKGSAIYAFVTLKADAKPSEQLKQQLIQQCRTVIGAIATPKTIQWAPALPKTRSGKIMRRILRKIADNELDDLGDTSTLADPNVVEELIKAR